MNENRNYYIIIIIIILNAVSSTELVLSLVRTLLHIQERLRVEHSLQDVLFKAAIKGSPPAQRERYRILQIISFLLYKGGRV